jgi:ABC-type branched-subunit amino acid transport system ATPase component
MVALGRALMAGTRLVLVDEPFQGLAPVLAVQYAEALGRLRQVRPDLCVIITESNASLLKDIPDQTITLERGELHSESRAPQLV